MHYFQLEGERETKGVLAPGLKNAAERRGYAAEDGERESVDDEKM